MPRFQFRSRLALIALLTVLLRSPVAAQPESRIDARLRDDLAVLQAFRPAFRFWQHVFTIPDGRIAFGNATDGRLVATFPTRGDVTRSGSSPRWPPR
ncbi:MAG: hypothetical protein R2708_28595 [Vicinamibacterales bacterium]